MKGPAVSANWWNRPHTATGRYYHDVKVGSGKKAAPGKEVTVGYTFWLPAGDQLQKSADDQPFVFAIGEHHATPGWEEGVTGMKVGGQRQLIVPATLGYGGQGSGQVPPNGNLVFMVELKGVK